jgi:sulfate transport system permease protein
VSKPASNGAAAATAGRLPSPWAAIRLPRAGSALNRGLVTLYLSLIVLLPLAAVAAKSLEDGLGGFWDAITMPQAIAALRLTVVSSLIVVVVNIVFGTLIAWVMVRDEFPGKKIVNALIDLPFALPTIVSGIVLLTLYGKNSPIGLSLSLTPAAVVLALLFVTLPFVVRAVQPLLIELDREMEQAAASLGASNFTIFRRIVFPNLLPGIMAGAALAFARALGEFGSIILISGNRPFETEVAAVYIRARIEQDNLVAASAVSVLLLAVSLLLLTTLTLIQRWAVKRES